MDKSELNLRMNVRIREKKRGEEKSRLVKEYHNVIRPAGLEGLFKQMVKLETEKYPAKIGVGISSATPNNPPPTLTDATIKDILKGNLTYQSGSVFAYVVYGFEEANHTWSETGLLFTDDTIIARVVDTVDPYVKTNQTAASLQWQIRLTEDIT